MTLIVDASVAVKWFAKEDQIAEARLLLDRDDLAAPEFIFLELFHALWNLARRNQFHMHDIEPSLMRMRDVFAYFAPQETLRGDAMRLALHRNLAIYDCLYIALAQREGATLITADEKQLAIARQARSDVKLL